MNIEEDVFAFNCRRALVRTPSRAINTLAKKIPTIFNEEVITHNTCQATTVNFVATLVIAKYLHKYHEIYRRYHVDEEQLNQKEARILVPYQVHQKLPLLYKDGDTISTVEAPSVLVKHAVGHLVGVVLTGELAGLIVYGIGNTEVAQGMGISRIWNDDPLGEVGYDLPAFVLHHLTDSEGNDNKLLIELTQEFKRHYENDPHTRQFTGSMKTFIGLCKERGIQVDEKAFHATRGF